MKTKLYFDNAATTYPKPECVYRAMDKASREIGVNAGRGAYSQAQDAMELMESSRNLIFEFIKSKTVAEVVFTASATVAFNEIVGGISWKESDVVYVSPFEHNAVARTLYAYQKRYGFTIEELPIKKDCLEIDLKLTEYAFTRRKPDYVFMSHVSNVTGYISPIEEISKLAKKHNAIVVVDAAQSTGLLSIDIREGTVDFVVFAGHKTMYGPFGIAGFVNNNQIKLNHFLFGGTGSDSLNLDMPDGINGFEPGSPNIVAMAGLKAGLLYLKEQKDPFAHEQELTNYLIDGLNAIKKVRLYLPDDRTKQVGIVAMNIEGYKASEVGMILDEDYGVAVRTGYHCAPFIHKYLKDQSYLGVVRLSISLHTTKEEIDELLGAIREIAED